jgi:hypothetical protein
MPNQKRVQIHHVLISTLILAVLIILASFFAAPEADGETAPTDVPIAAHSSTDHEPLEKLALFHTNPILIPIDF